MQPYDGLPYSMDFALDERTDGIYVYTFVVKYTSSESVLKIYRERVEPSAAETEIFSETFTRSSTVKYPISVSDVILADDRSKFYFVLDYASETDGEAGQSELCTIAKAGTGSRTVLKTYENPLLSARSPVNLDNSYFYLEGGWVRSETSGDYPNEGGTLIEIESNDDITDHGIAWRSATILDSPDEEDIQYSGWGLHNSIISNMIADERGNLQFAAGYGMPYSIDDNASSPLKQIQRHFQATSSGCSGVRIWRQRFRVSPRLGIGVGIRFRIWRVQ